MSNGKHNDDEASARATVALFSNTDAYNHAVERIEIVETHISWVFLTGRYAYKVKKPVALPFLDFSTLEKRRIGCENELRLNRRLAPSLYVDVVAMGGEPGACRIGAEPALEYAVKMRQFGAGARLDRRLASGAVDADAIRAFAEVISGFHASLPPADAHGTSLDAFERNLAELETALGPAASRLAGVTAWLGARRVELERALAQRQRGGFVRECHGDLHLENLVLLEGRVTPFDALEFSESLRTIDVLDEIAFPTMDLSVHGRPDLAHVFLNRCLEISGDYAGLRLLDFYRLHRSLVRAKVRAIRRGQTADAADAGGLPYLDFAEALIGAGPNRLIVTRGLSGSGKTRIAQALVARLPAISLRSDLERKRLFGLPPDADSGSGIASGIYTPEASLRTYRALERAADAALASRLDVIVDAAFLERAERNAFATLARRRGAAFAILDCVAPETLLRERIASRQSAGRDASEATGDVLDHQLATQEPLDDGERARAVTVDTAGRPDLDAIASALRRLSPD